MILGGIMEKQLYYQVSELLPAQDEHGDDVLHLSRGDRYVWVVHPQHLANFLCAVSAAGIIPVAVKTCVSQDCIALPVIEQDRGSGEYIGERTR